MSTERMGLVIIVVGVFLFLCNATVLVLWYRAEMKLIRQRREMYNQTEQLLIDNANNQEQFERNIRDRQRRLEGAAEDARREHRAWLEKKQSGNASQDQSDKQCDRQAHGDEEQA